MNLTIITITIFFILSFFLLKSKDEIKELKEELNAKKQVIESLIKITMFEKPIIRPETALPELDIVPFQTLILQFKDLKNNLSIFCEVNVSSKVDYHGDNETTPFMVELDPKIMSVELDVFDENGDLVVYNTEIIKKEILVLLKKFYEK